MEAATDNQVQGGESEEPPRNNENEIENLVAKAQELMTKITSSRLNPSPKVLNAIASMLETQESRYMEELGNSAPNNGRASHNIGRLGNVVRDNDEFFELISSEFLSDSRFSLSIQSASIRLLLSCSTTWVFPHVFEDAVLENIKNWVINDSSRSNADEPDKKKVIRRDKPTDSETLGTYATGLLAVCLSGGGQIVEDVLTSGLPAKLMRFLRIRVLGDTNISQKDANYQAELKNASSSMRSRDDSRSRSRQVPESTHLDGSKIGDEGLLVEHNFERGDVGGSCEPREVVDDMTEGVDKYDVNEHVGEGRWHIRDLLDDKTKLRGLPKARARGRTNEEAVESDKILTSPGSGIRVGAHGKNTRDRSSHRNADAKRGSDAKISSSRIETDGFIERSDSDDHFKEFKIGTTDISDLVKKATRAAEAEASEANASLEAIKHAGDGAAEHVKAAALEVFHSTNDEGAAVAAAAEAVRTIINAANAPEVSRSSSNVKEDPAISGSVEIEKEEEYEGYFILDCDSLAQLKEKYCIQCLDSLGEYVEVLGPVLHEKGVDVCLALLQRSSKSKEVSKVMMLLPDVLKLVCALVAHRKFAQTFVDRGGIQKLLAVPRVGHTFFGLSSCLFTIGSQGIMERVCALPSDVVYHVVELALQLLECNQDLARKNAALFFAAAFIFRAIVESFDSQEGLKKLLNLLQAAASVRSGSNSGTLGLSNGGSLRNDRSPGEVLTALEKQVAYHSCVALRQYFRGHLLLLVESLRPSKSSRNAGRNMPSARAAYKPLDISNEAVDAVFIQIQRDRKLGTAFVRSHWPAVEKFLEFNGHITMLELCHAPPVERYLHDLAQYALGVLHIVTLVPSGRRSVVNATLNNNRVGMAVLLDAANAAGCVDPEVIQPALNVLVNLVCPPPSISLKPSVSSQAQQSLSLQTPSGPAAETKEGHAGKNFSDRSISERNESSTVAERGGPLTAERGASVSNSNLQTAVPTMNSGVVGDRRISLGPGAGSLGLATQLEQGYWQAREAVRANNGIKVLLYLLHPRVLTPPASLDCLRALACRVLLGLARDDSIAHILTKLEVGKKLSELIRDPSGQPHGSEQGRWQAELAQVSIELISIVTNSGRSNTLAATDAAAPTLRRIERAAIAAATPISYHSRELLLLIHEHLQASGLNTTAASLLRESQLTPLPSLAGPLPPLHQTSLHEAPTMQLHWPSRGFLSKLSKPTVRLEEPSISGSLLASTKKKALLLSNRSFQSRNPSSAIKISSALKSPIPSIAPQTPTVSMPIPNSDSEPQFKTPTVLPMKRKPTDFKDCGFASSAKRLAMGEHGFRSPVHQTPNAVRKNNLPIDIGFPVTPSSSQIDHNGKTPGGTFADNTDDTHHLNTPSGQMTPSNSFQMGLQPDPQPGNSERVTLDSLVVQYLKHQHRQCPAPITTLPPLSLLHPHMCPEPRRNMELPANVTSRLSTREFRNHYGGIHGTRRDRQFIYSRFRPWRTCRDDSALLTCIAFVGDSSRIVTGNHSGELKIFDSESGNILESSTGHQSPLTRIQSALSGDTQLILSSGSYEVRLWDGSSILGGPMHSFDGCKAARFNNSKTMFAALSTETSPREVLLYDIQTCNLLTKFSDAASSSGPGRVHVQSLIHFHPDDERLLWNGVLWDKRTPSVVRQFDQFTDYGGGGFHPAGNEVIINSEVWDLRNFKLLRSVPSLDQTVITFNTSGDVIYAILRRNVEDITSAVNSRRVRHPLFSAFRTVDAVNYSDIATVPVDRCVLDFATEPTNSFVGLVSMDDHEEMFASARLYEIGRRRPADDDSDPDDAESEEDDGDDDSEDDEDGLMGADLVGDMDSDLGDMSHDDDDDDEEDDDDDDDLGDDEDDGLDGDFGMDVDDDDDGDFGGVLEIVTDGEDDDSETAGFSSGDEGDFP
ncbi:hypothetical protein MKX03_004351 [Papaver bracteatum]|nr:hypothetical protein MKX03_004351 [Papaver bracteatum]